MVPAQDLEVHVRDQVQAVKAVLSPLAAPQMYLNFAGAQRDPARFWNEQAYQRLGRIKAAVDPDDLILSNHPVPIGLLTEIRCPGRQRTTEGDFP
jgi:Berberine and berberine like